jgi:putative transposase
MACYSGKQSGETSLLRQLLDRLEAGDVLLADAMFSHYWTIALLLGRGVDLVSRHDGKRKLDVRLGRRLGRYDHIVAWHKPKRPVWLSQQLYDRLPETLSIRELKVDIHQKGFRCRHLYLVTTLLDAEHYSDADLATAFRARWHAELDVRSIKHVMQMDVLRCKSPAMVRKELWMHLLAYNLVRKLMANAAESAGLCPRDISFKGTLQTLVVFSVAGWVCCEPRERLYAAVLRTVKRRPKKAAYLNEPRTIAKARLLKRA